MKKKWLYSAAAVGMTAILSVPLMGFSSEGKGEHHEAEREHIKLQSGGIAVPFAVPPFNTATYHEPADGIITGAEGCQPDVHTFDKSATGIGPNGPEPEHIVFTAGVKEIATQAAADKFDASGAAIYVKITSNGEKVLEQQFGPTPVMDPNTNKPFWVSALYFKGNAAGPGRSTVNLPTGEYNYKFYAKDKNGHVIGEWTPKNHKFTVTDSSVK